MERHETLIGAISWRQSALEREQELETLRAQLATVTAERDAAYDADGRV